jgi:hypothetical protein
LARKRIGRSKVLADKARGDIEARIERGEAGLLNRDYPIPLCVRISETIPCH